MVRSNSSLAILAVLGAAAALAGCDPGPAPTTTGVLEQMRQAFVIPFTHAPDADQDACLYPIVKALWEEYAWQTSSASKADFKYQLLSRYDSVEFGPTVRVATLTGKANVLYCQLGWANSNGGGPDWIVEKTCGTRLIDLDNYQVVGENRDTNIVVETHGKVLSIHAESLDVEGDFPAYRVRNLQGEFKIFKSVQDPLFQHYLGAAPAGNGLPFGMLLAVTNPHITYPTRIARGVHCGRTYNGRALELKDLLK
jgi:hypothetical protein